VANVLARIKGPADLRSLTHSELTQLADEIRTELVNIVTRTGGHLASSLGVIELSIALHRVFDSPRDKIIWDVGHQSYTHKLLTGRRERFDTLRQYHGLAGFPDPAESPHDVFGTGHASTSVSASLGIAMARDLACDDFHVVAVIGDGALTGGMAFEGLNHAGHLGTRLIVILNDNAMAISPSVGAVSRTLHKLTLDPRYYRAKEGAGRVIQRMPWGKIAWGSITRVKSGIKEMLIPTQLWESLGFKYIGPVDGHNIAELEEALTKARDYPHRPVFIHVVTVKGKGYEPAEDDCIKFHGVSAKGTTSSNTPSYSEVFGQTMLRLFREDERLVAVSAATQGYIPIVAIYSTFLQRAFDQVLHDVCIQDLPIVFAIDRAGIVGEDGKTHQGTFDLSYLGCIPGLVIAAPSDENEMRHLLYTAVKASHPMAIRYPRNSGLGVPMDEHFQELPVGKGEVLKHGNDLAIIAIGSTVAPAMEAAKLLGDKGVNCAVVNARFAKPLDSDLILELASRTKRLVTVEENALIGGFGSAVLSLLSNKTDISLLRIGIPDEFVEHGSQELLRAHYSLDAEGITDRILSFFPELVRLSPPTKIKG